LIKGLIIRLLKRKKHNTIEMTQIKISVTDSSRQKIVVVVSRETKEKLRTNIEMGRVNLDRWLRD